jgi:hypothetical protein
MIGVSGAGAALGAAGRPQLVIMVPAQGWLAVVIVVWGPVAALGAPARPQPVIMVGTAAVADVRAGAAAEIVLYPALRATGQAQGKWTYSYSNGLSLMPCDGGAIQPAILPGS